MIDRWILEPDAKTLLMTFELNDFNQPCGQLSGGQKKRAALAKTLLRPADILILDEPTNHLDTKMADWLEDYLRRYRGAMIMVTHDRYFLDQVTNRITELIGNNLHKLCDLLRRQRCSRLIQNQDVCTTIENL